jgi:hypothetical protein
MTRVVHRNAGVEPRFRVVDAPLDLRFALVWGKFTLYYALLVILRLVKRL